MTPTNTKSWQHRTIYQVVQNKQLRTVSLHSSTASTSKSSQGFPSLVWKILFPLFFLYFLLVVGTEYNYITCSITIYMWITLSSNLLRSPRILKQTTPTCSNGSGLAFPDIFRRNPRFATLEVILPKMQRRIFSFPRGKARVSPPGRGWRVFSKWYFDIWEKPSILVLIFEEFLDLGNKNLEDIILFSAVSLKNYVILKMSFWISLNSPVFPYLWLTPSFTIWNEKSYLLGKVQLAFRANQSCRNWCRCLWTIRRADSTVGRQHT